ncbi:MAG: pyridoxal-dependent decarboxylase [Bacteroidales bacterium]|nr:pyridoxal-dependent decarboxylase [Bacteroidales bacterium]
MNQSQLSVLSAKYGSAFYLLDTQQFKKNFIELKSAFATIYPNTNIAYSYKTNYIPALCKIVDELGGLAEVVSDMELNIARKVGVKPYNIIWNGPYKNPQEFETLLVEGGQVNLDSFYETELLKTIAKNHPEKILNVGVRVNFAINDNTVSRFGFDVESKEFFDTLSAINQLDNVKLLGIQCHYATRRLETWRPRAEKMLSLLNQIGIVPPRIDLGGGLYGKIHESLKKQFDAYIPTYQEYAQEVAPLFAEKFGSMPNPPLLLIEPGSALVGDCMSFVAKVVSIKNIRGQYFATLLGSSHNINISGKNPPLTVYPLANERFEYDNLNFVGYTCIESDVLYRGFNGFLGVGDFVEFANAGSYSVVLKPPFILPNFPVLDISGDNPVLIKRQECFDDIFRTYSF